MTLAWIHYFAGWIDYLAQWAWYWVLCGWAYASFYGAWALGPVTLAAIWLCMTRLSHARRYLQ